MSSKTPDDSWQKSLSKEQYAILRQGQTERPFSGSLLGCRDRGLYLCGACEKPLFASETKFDSGSGWPSFYKAMSKTVVELEDDSHSMRRIEVLCQQCQSHLGHVFDDAPQTPTGRRYCINSGALKFKDRRGKMHHG